VRKKYHKDGIGRKESSPLWSHPERGTLEALKSFEKKKRKKRDIWPALCSSSRPKTAHPTCRPIWNGTEPIPLLGVDGGRRLHSARDYSASVV